MSNHEARATSAAHPAKEASMCQAEAICHEFFKQYPTPNVVRGMALARGGTITWPELAGVFERGLSAGLKATVYAAVAADHAKAVAR